MGLTVWATILYSVLLILTAAAFLTKRYKIGSALIGVLLAVTAAIGYLRFSSPM